MLNFELYMDGSMGGITKYGVGKKYMMCSGNGSEKHGLSEYMC
jgi:hypothetical protein